MMTSFIDLHQQIQAFKKKYYVQQVVRGLLISATLLLSAYLVVNFLEFFARLSTFFRAGLLGLFITLLAYVFRTFLWVPLQQWLGVRHTLTDEDAARFIGQFFPDIQDKLVNTLQLANLPEKDNALLQASISQKAAELRLFEFPKAVKWEENKPFAWYLFFPLAISLGVAFFRPEVFTSSTERIIYFTKDFADPAPFQFRLLNSSLQAFQQDDFVLEVELTGTAFPEEVFLELGDRRIKMVEKEGNPRIFQHTFSRMQESSVFRFWAGGYASNSYEITVRKRPVLSKLEINLKYPAYLGKDNETIENQGNLILPAGTEVTWSFFTDEADALVFIPTGKPMIQIPKPLVGAFSWKQKVLNTLDYRVTLRQGDWEEPVGEAYQIQVIPDEFPRISLEQVIDTTLFEYIALGGTISDDYGLSKLTLYRRVIRSAGETEPFQPQALPLSPSSISQNYYAQIPLPELRLMEGDQVEYYVQVWDNDGVKGPKATRSGIQRYVARSQKQLQQSVDQSVERAEKQFERTQSESKDLQIQLKALEEKLKKNEFDLQDKKALQQLLKKREELRQSLDELRQQLGELQQKQKQFEQPSPRLQEKMQQLQQLIQDLLKSQDNQLFEELKKMLEQADEKSLQEQMEKIQKNERNSTRDIERTLRMFKNIQFQQQMERLEKNLEKLANQEEKLGKDLEKKAVDPAEAENQQKDVEKAFEELREEMKQVEKLGKEIKRDADMSPETQKEIQKDLKEAGQELDQQKPQEAAKRMQKAARQMKSMAQKLNSQMQQGEMMQMNEDMDALRALLDNLLTLSFQQEKLMKNLRAMGKTDPRLNETAQDQLKLTQDAQVIEDSLYALANRVLQIQSFVTKEVTQMKNFMDESVRLLREKQYAPAAGKQQFAMTSMNNLALLLSDTFAQMQQMMANQMPGKGKGKNKSQVPMPGFGEKQKEINERIDQLGQMSGKKLSEELARLAQEQARLRRQLQEAQEKLSGTEGGKKVGNEIQELQQQMEESENELVNKRISPQLKNRQKEVQTRLLEVDKAIKEQEMDPTRKGQTATEWRRNSPPDLLQYKNLKQKQLESLRLTPPAFTPFYKDQANQYFKRLN